eukprot:6475056-Amphidinium_carterae.1
MKPLRRALHKQRLARPTLIHRLALNDSIRQRSTSTSVSSCTQESRAKNSLSTHNRLPRQSSPISCASFSAVSQSTPSNVHKENNASRSYSSAASHPTTVSTTQVTRPGMHCPYTHLKQPVATYTSWSNCLSPNG